MMKSIRNTFNHIRERAARARALSMSDDQLAADIKSYVAEHFNEVGAVDVKIAPTHFYQQGHKRKGTSIRVELQEHCADYPLMQMMSGDIARKYSLTNAHLVGVYNGAAPIREGHLAEEAEIAAEAQKAANGVTSTQPDAQPEAQPDAAAPNAAGAQKAANGVETAKPDINPAAPKP